MSLQIKYLASPNHSSRNEAKIELLVLHATVGSYASSLAWLRNPASKASTHYLIDRDGATTQLVADDRAAWHAGVSRHAGHTNINERSIGVELVNRNSGRDPYPPAQLEAARLLCRSLASRYRIARNDAVRHLDIALPLGRKTDPAPPAFPWPAFADSIYALPPAPTMPRPTQPAPRDYVALGIPVYQRPDRTGDLWGYLLPGAEVTIDDAQGHLADGRGWIDVRGLVVRPQ